jgi:hypothetical protein
MSFVLQRVNTHEAQHRAVAADSPASSLEVPDSNLDSQIGYIDWEFPRYR